MSRWGLRATAPRAASAWCNLGKPRGDVGVRPMRVRTKMGIHMAWQTNKQSSGAHSLVKAALPSFTFG